MKTLLLIATLLAAPLALAAKDAAKDAPSWIAAEGRDSDAVKQDASRKPMETLNFLGLKKGAQVLDFGAGNGYYTQIIARAVGPKGRVVALTPAGSIANPKAKAKWATLMAAHKNVAQSISNFDAFPASPKSYSFVLFHLEYHDLYWQSARFGVPRTDPDMVLKKLYGAMKSGGIVGVVDHMGTKGDTRAIVEATHRIDPEVVKADFARAGFKFVGESGHLRTRGDDYAKNVFDPVLRGKTDRFVLKFKK
jgi:predicted methyltransferase